MKKILLILFTLSLLITSGCIKTTEKIVKVGSQKFTVEIAKTAEERQQGLMNRENLTEGHGMIFIFDEERMYPFWMKNTLIPLDMIWISRDMKVADVITAEPCKVEKCPNYQPKEKALYVLEVNAGEFEGEIGSEVWFVNIVD